MSEDMVLGGLRPLDATAGEISLLQGDRGEDVCSRPGCGKRLMGRQLKWCSPACYWKVWDRLHPRQRTLFPAQPIAPLQDQRVDVADRPKLTGDNVRILCRLRMGPATGAQLAGWLCDEAGANASAWRSRVSDCRRWLQKHTGETIKTVRLEPRKYLYSIEANP